LNPPLRLSVARRVHLASVGLTVGLTAGCGAAPSPAKASLAMLARGSVDPSPRAEATGPSACDLPGADEDEDGLVDACEDELADRFAPVVYHSSDESNLPTNVDRFLAQSTLGFFDDACAPDLRVELVRAPRQSQLLGHEVDATCGGHETVDSGGTRSVRKARTFFLKDLPVAARAGSFDSRDWTTYVHAYPSDGGGITVQYWRFYAYNDALNDHGGDWEGLHVVLDASREVAKVRFLAHASMEEWLPASLGWEGRHVRVFSEGGGHATRGLPFGIRARDCENSEPCMIDPSEPSTFIRQETWRDGSVAWPEGQSTPGGRLVNVGEKRAPLHGQVFIQYSGLWGSPGLLYGTSGYWGPAFNETDMRRDGFASAWCVGMLSPELVHECWPSTRSR
jgi:hypothetical protein